MTRMLILVIACLSCIAVYSSDQYPVVRNQDHPVPLDVVSKATVDQSKITVEGNDGLAKWLRTDPAVRIRIEAYVFNPKDPEPAIISDRHYKGTANQNLEWQEWAIRNAKIKPPRDGDGRRKTVNIRRGVED